jgi:hypothetical protein
MDQVNYNNLFSMIDTNRTFTEIGKPDNVLKTAVVMNVLMLMLTISMCFIPIPFMAPITIIAYIVGFCAMNIKFMSDFSMAFYQTDNLQIQSNIIKYTNSKDKIIDIQKAVEKKLEDEYQEITNADKKIDEIYKNVWEEVVKTNTLLEESTRTRIKDQKPLIDLPAVPAVPAVPGQ